VALNEMTPTLKEAKTMKMWRYVWSKRKDKRNLNLQKNASAKF